MKFGIFVNQMFHEPGVSHHADLAAQVRLMDQLGFDVAILGERHQRQGGFTELVTVLPWLAAQTTRLRIASGGFILAIHHPYRLAQQTAYIDVVSGGRFDFGVVLGYFGGDFDPYGIPVAERLTRFTEGLSVIRKLWRGEPVSHHGKHYRFDNAFIAPRPVQQPGPPVWIAAKVDAAIRRAAALGDGWFPSANDGLDDLKRKFGVYREALQEAKKPLREVILLRDGFVAASTQAARAIAEEPMLGLFREYFGWKKDSPDADRYDASFETAMPKLVFGSPQQAIDQIAQYQALGVTTLALRCQYPGLSHHDTMRCLELIGTKVMPAFRR